jgi:hypothetical protein
MNDIARLTQAFYDKLLESVMVSKNELNYNPTYFVRMLSEHGCIETAKQLILSKQYSEGFTKLWELGRLDLTVEAIVLHDEFRALFSPEVILAAQKRLHELNYDTTI